MNLTALNAYANSFKEPGGSMSTAAIVYRRMMPWRNHEKENLVSLTIYRSLAKTLLLVVWMVTPFNKKLSRDPSDPCHRGKPFNLVVPCRFGLISSEKDTRQMTQLHTMCMCV